MGILNYIYGSPEKVQAVVRDVFARTVDGAAAAIGPAVVLTANETVDIKGGVLLFGFIAVVPPVLRAAANVPRNQHPNE